ASACTMAWRNSSTAGISAVAMADSSARAGTAVSSAAIVVAGKGATVKAGADVDSCAAAIDPDGDGSIGAAGASDAPRAGTETVCAAVALTDPVDDSPKAAALEPNGESEGAALTAGTGAVALGIGAARGAAG